MYDLNNDSNIISNLTLTDIFANKRCLKKNQCLRKRKNQCFSDKKCKLITKIKLKKRNKNIRISMDDNRGFFIWKTTKLVKQILKNLKNVFLWGIYGINKYLFSNLLKHQYLIQFFFRVKLKKKKLNKSNIIIQNKKFIILSKIQYLFSPLKKNIQNNKFYKNKILRIYKQTYIQYKWNIKKFWKEIPILLNNFINKVSYKWWFISEWLKIKFLLKKKFNENTIYKRYIVNFYETKFNYYLKKNITIIFLEVIQFIKNSDIKFLLLVLLIIQLKKKKKLLLLLKTNNKYVKASKKLEQINNSKSQKLDIKNILINYLQFTIKKKKNIINFKFVKKNYLNNFFYISLLHKLIYYKLIISLIQLKKNKIKKSLLKIKFYLLQIKKIKVNKSKNFLKKSIFITHSNNKYYFINYKYIKLVDSYLIKIKEIKQMRMLRYVKYLLYKESNYKKKSFIDKNRSYLFLDHENTFIIDPIYIKKKKKNLKATDLTFWGIESNKEIKNKFVIKSKRNNELIYWFSSFERRIDNILIRSNLLNNLYFIRSCILENNILINKNIINIYTYNIKKWDILSLPNYVRFILYKLLLKRLTYKKNSKYKKFLNQKIKELMYYQYYKDTDFKSIKFKSFKNYLKKKKRDYNKFPQYKLILLNFPKYLELNYKLCMCILLKINFNKQDFNKPFSAYSLALKNDISLYFNLINNKIYRKNKIKK